MHDLETRVRRLAAVFPDFSEDLLFAYTYVRSDAGSSLTKSRTVLEKLLLALYVAATGREPKAPLLGPMLTDNQFTRTFDRRIFARMNSVRDMGNLGPHGEAVRACDAARVLEDLCEILDWQHQRRNGASPPPVEGTEPVAAGVEPTARGVEDQGGKGGGVLVTTDAARIELVIDGDFDSFSPEKQERVLRAIKELLGGGGEIRLVSKRRGSIKLTLEMTHEQAERLLWAVQAGDLAGLGVVGATLFDTVSHGGSPANPPVSEPVQPEDDIESWIAQLRARNPDAAQRLWERYFRQLVALARARLGAAPRRAADEEDIALDAFMSFCRGVEESRFPHINDRADLWQLLVLLTARKAAAYIRRESQAKRGGGKVLGEADLEAEGGSVGGGLEQVLAREPTPEFAAQVAEEYRRLINVLGDEQLRTIALLRLEGRTIEEIATKVGCAMATVARRLNRIRHIWSEEKGPA
jgi:DNA-directed RNA polymerase specialized sigma24 family protein